MNFKPCLNPSRLRALSLLRGVRVNQGTSNFFRIKWELPYLVVYSAKVHLELSFNKGSLGIMSSNRQVFPIWSYILHRFTWNIVVQLAIFMLHNIYNISKIRRNHSGGTNKFMKIHREQKFIYEEQMSVSYYLFIFTWWAGLLLITGDCFSSIHCTVSRICTNFRFLLERDSEEKLSFKSTKRLNHGSLNLKRRTNVTILIWCWQNWP